MRNSSKSTRAQSGGMFAWARHLAGPGALVLASAMAVPAALLVSAAPASAGEKALPTGGSLVQSVPCTSRDSIEAATTPNGEEGDHLCGQIPVTKLDSWTGKPIAGAGFSLYWGSCPKTGLPDSGDLIKGPNPATNPVTTDSSGVATFSPVYFKWWGGKSYCVVESTVPAGYTGAAPQTVTVYGHYKDYSQRPPVVTCTAPVNSDQQGPNAVQDNTETLPQICVTSATFENAPDPVNIDITKYVAGSTPPLAGLNGATFTLQNTNGSAVTTGPKGVVNGAASCITTGGTSTTGATCQILNIMIAGTYQLAETQPAGYNPVAPVPVTVTLGTPPIQVIAENTAIVVVSAPQTAAASGGTVSGATTVHTGEAFAGSGPYAAATLAAGASFLALGLARRRSRARHLGA